MLNLLGSLCKRLKIEHEFFRKDYVKPCKKQITDDLNDELVENVGQFFNNLPEKFRKGKKRTSNLLSLTKKKDRIANCNDLRNVNRSCKKSMPNCRKKWLKIRKRKPWSVRRKINFR